MGPSRWRLWHMTALVAMAAILFALVRMAPGDPLVFGLLGTSFFGILLGLALRFLIRMKEPPLVGKFPWLPALRCFLVTAAVLAAVLVLLLLFVGSFSLLLHALSHRLHLR